MLHETRAEWLACVTCARNELPYDGPADSGDSDDACWDETLAGPEYRMWADRLEHEPPPPFPWGLPCE